MTNLIQSLNAGSGIDVKALAASLVEAERAPRVELLDAREARVEARISALAQFRSGVDGLLSALDTRIRSGSLSGIARVSDPSVVRMEVAPGATVPRQQLEVRALAQGQTLASQVFAADTAAVGEGQLTIRFGSVAGTSAATGFTAGTIPALEVTIGPDTNSVAGLRAAILDAAGRAGVPLEARIVPDTGGVRLQLIGPSGEANGFTISTTGSADLQRFAFGVGVSGGLERSRAATDARVAVDGLEVRRQQNRITDLVPGAVLTLERAAPGQIVTLAAERDPAELQQAVRDLAGALNELVGFGRELSQGSTSGGAAGALVSDGTTRRVLQQLGSLTSRQLVAANGVQPTRLSELGLTVDRTGTFTVDEVRLARAVREAPGAVEAMLTALTARGTVSAPAGPLRQMATLLREATQGQPGQRTALQREADAIARDRAQLEARMERLSDSYTRQFTALDLAVGQSRQLRTYLQQQIDLWTNRSDR